MHLIRELAIIKGQMIKWSQFLFLFFNNLISIPTYLYIGFVSHFEHSLGAVITYLKQTQNLKEDYLKIPYIFVALSSLKSGTYSSIQNLIFFLPQENLSYNVHSCNISHSPRL